MTPSCQFDALSRRDRHQFVPTRRAWNKVKLIFAWMNMYVQALYTGICRELKASWYHRSSCRKQNKKEYLPIPLTQRPRYAFESNEVRMLMPRCDLSTNETAVAVCRARSRLSAGRSHRRTAVGTGRQ